MYELKKKRKSCWLDESVKMPCLVLQGGHALLQVELQPFVGLREQTVHGVRQTLVVLLVHFLPLTSLKSKTGRTEGKRNNFVTFFSLIQILCGRIYAAN